MRSRRRPASSARPALAAAVALGVVAGCGEEPPARLAEPARALAAISASCASAAGVVEVRRAGQREYEEVAPGSVFRKGDEIRTGPLSRARIELVAGGGLELEETAAVVVADAAPPDPAVAVNEGVVRGLLADGPDGGAPRALVIATGDGGGVRVTAQGGRAAFRLSRKERGTELAVTGGHATVRGARGAATLAAGQVTLASGGGVGEIAELIDSPQIVAPASDARIQLDPALTTRLAWRPVPGATAYRVQVARDLSFQRSLLNVTVEGTEVTFSPREAGVYAWRVASVDGERRQGEYGSARRLHCESSAPRDLLVEPADGARVRFGDSLPAVEFSWEASGEPRRYRIVLASGRDLLAQSAVTAIVSGPRAELRIPAAGEYHWGVYMETEEGPRPIFSSPRRLSVRKLARAKVGVPPSLSSWGD